MKKRGQVSIFIIIAIVIVVAAIGIYFIYPRITGTPVSSSPTEFIQNCLEDEIKGNAEQISLNGGSLNPIFYSEYYKEGEKFNVEYLCYTNENYKQCIMQQPMLKSHIESEIKNSINDRVKKCFDDLENNYKKKSFAVDLKRNNYEVVVTPQNIEVILDYDLTLTKGATDKYDEFIVEIDSNLYRLVNIASEIANGEAQYGDADVSGYMTIYYWLKTEKIKQTEGTKIYILTDRESKEKFMFASRSVVLPPGY